MMRINLTLVIKKNSMILISLNDLLIKKIRILNVIVTWLDFNKYD